MNAGNLWNYLLTIFEQHWHVILTHFPISFFMASAGFMFLHLITDTACFELAGFLTLVAGTIMMIPATATGWWTWKTKYKGAATLLFWKKINISIGMIAVSVVLIIARGFFIDISHTFWHWLFGAGFLLLFVAGMAEGAYGGRLNHH